jgi:hypothetical protein
MARCLDTEAVETETALTAVRSEWQTRYWMSSRAPVMFYFVSCWLPVNTRCQVSNLSIFGSCETHMSDFVYFHKFSRLLLSGKFGQLSDAKNETVSRIREIRSLMRVELCKHVRNVDLLQMQSWSKCRYHSDKLRVNTHTQNERCIPVRAYIFRLLSLWFCTKFCRMSSF